MRKFCENYGANCSDFEDILEEMDRFEIQKNNKKIKKTLQIMDFVYTRIVRFLDTDFCTQNLITTKLFEIISQIAFLKIHLDRSHVTGKIRGYAYNFFNWKVRENHNFTCLDHNLFGFDCFFLLKGICLGVWKIKDLSIQGSNLTNIIIASSSNQIKFVDTFKYYQQSLAKLASAITTNEKTSAKNMIRQFLS